MMTDSPNAHTPLFMPTRAQGLIALNSFLPSAGGVYAKMRNFDLGREDRHNVSMLSPYIRHRLLTEDEVVRAVCAQHDVRSAEKFIQEVFWRTYWKGWLEMRPSVWRDWQADVARLSSAEGDRDADIRAATQGETGIDAFDHWARELTETGYLHNHARMWFASIWIFTLGLPWQLGAAFFLRHLLDGDPASNTLSWRWVAGLQTLGKTYRATAENISTFTNGRFAPVLEDRFSSTSPLTAPPSSSPPVAAPPMVPLPALAPAPKGPALLLLTQEDLHPESLPLSGVEVAGIATLPASSADVSPNVHSFRTAALADALGRASAHFQVAGSSVSLASIVDHAKTLGVDRIVTANAPVGPTADMVKELSSLCADQGLSLCRVRRDWDSAAWPLATKGFFPFRQHIPALLAR